MLGRGMKNWLIPIVAGLSALAVNSCTETEAQIQTVHAPIAHGNFQVRRCINLGNGLEAETEGAWGYTVRHEDLKRIRAAGFDTIRLPVRWDNKTSRRAPYRIDPAYMARVKQIIDQAHALGLGIILDVHHYEELYSHTDRELPRLMAIWDQISRTFHGFPGRLYFEPVNEPFPYGDMASVNRVYQAVIPVIRKFHPDRPIILGGNNWNSVQSLSEINWPHDPNIVATFHDYVPHEFTHQGNSWEGSPPPLGRRWGSRKDIREMRHEYAQAKAFQNRTGLPVFVGEFGVINTIPDRPRAEWLAERRRIIEANGFSWCAWSFSGSFDIYDTSRETWRTPLLRALIP